MIQILFTLISNKEMIKGIKKTIQFNFNATGVY
jgi:hypothetical protein